MKKVDLHIHTVPTISEASFEFDIEVLQTYVKRLNLDAIAITNHNVFDLDQFNNISSILNIDVFPGVEIDLEKGHILLISKKDKASDLNAKCKILFSNIKDEKSTITFERFIQIFPDYHNDLIIPHFIKEPTIKEETLEKFGENIFCGEVRNIKKFEKMKKSNEKITPVLFSDLRVEKGLKDFPTRITYIDIEEIDIPKLKIALMDRTKVYSSPRKDDSFFQILNDGTLASTKLNLVVGKRSTGKTYTLNQISKSFGKDSVKYIKQFEIINKCDDDEFEKIIREEQELIVEKKIEPLKNLIGKVIENEDYDIYTHIEKYLSSLKEFSRDQSLSDIYSNTKLFTESAFDEEEPNELKSLIEYLISIYKTTKYSEIIERYLLKENIEKLIHEMKHLYLNEKKEFILKEETDTIVSYIKTILSSASTLNSIDDCDFYKIMYYEKSRNMFDKVINEYKEKKEIYTKDLFRFKVKVYKQKIESTMELKTELRTGVALRDAYENLYSHPYKFLRKLLSSNIPFCDLYKSIVKMKYIIVNESGNNISGGERAEFNLLNEIEDSYRYDILLMDEPESSFDNIFIKNYIIDKIKQIAEKIPVFIVTHNNTLGTLLQPNWIIYTDFVKSEFSVYAGEFTSHTLKTADGKTMTNHTVLMDAMEAGNDAYDRRRLIYEKIKD